METTNSIQSGISEETTFIVEDQHTASQIGSGTFEGFINSLFNHSHGKDLPPVAGKKIARRFVQCGGSGECQASGAHTIGQPGQGQGGSDPGRGNRITFSVQAWDQTEKISEGEHLRIVIDVARFLKRVAAKQASLG